MAHGARAHELSEVSAFAIAGVGSILLTATGLFAARLNTRRRRRYLRLRVLPYRTDRATVTEIVAMYESLHELLLGPDRRRTFTGHASIALEVHLTGRGGRPAASLSVSCPVSLRRAIAGALRTAYPNVRLDAGSPPVLPVGCLLLLRKRRSYIERLRVRDPADSEPPLIDRLLTIMAATGQTAMVQIALTPAPAGVERRARRLHRRREASLVRRTGSGQRAQVRGASQVEDRELRGGLDIQHRGLFYGDVRVLASSRAAATQIAAELRAEGAENRLCVRRSARRGGRAHFLDRRVKRGEGSPIADRRRGIYASTELATLWQLPSVQFSGVPLERSSIPVAPASPAIARPARSAGLLSDGLGGVTIEPELRRQNTAVSGTVEQGKTSYLTGNLTRDPELRSLPSGLGVCNLRVACTTRRKNQATGDWDDRPNYFDVTVWGAQGETTARYLRRGRPVALDGRLEWREWEDADGGRRQSVGIVADSIQFLGAPVQDHEEASEVGASETGASGAPRAAEAEAAESF